MDYESLHLMAREWNGYLYAIVVNSATQQVAATISGLPACATQAEVLFEDVSLPATNGQLADTFDPLAVHIYKAPLTSSSLTITCPATASTVTDVGKNYASRVNLGPASTGGGCGSVTVSHNAPTQFPVGTNTVTWTARDAANNTATCQQGVIVRDNRAPTAPTNLNSPSKTRTSITLSWTVSTDNVGVAQYLIYRGGVQVGTSTTTAFTNTGLTGNTSYTYYVEARDAAGNVSVHSNKITVKIRR